MSIFKKLFNGAKEAVTSRVVGSRVRKELDKLDHDKMCDIVDGFSDMMGDMTQSMGYLACDLIEDNKESIIKLAEDNTDAVIAISKIGKELGTVIKALNTPENQAIIQAIKDKATQLSTEMDEERSPIMEAKANAINDNINDITKQFGYDMNGTKYFIYVNGKLTQVSENKFKLRKLAVTQNGGTWAQQQMEDHNHILETIKNTSEFYQNLGMSKDYADKL